VKLRVLPSRLTTQVVGIATFVAAVALFLGADLDNVTTATATLAALLLVFATVDFALTRRAWRESDVSLTRRLPSAFAIGV
jgi:hypothetical protein